MDKALVDQVLEKFIQWGQTAPLDEIYAFMELGEESDDTTLYTIDDSVYCEPDASAPSYLRVVDSRFATPLYDYPMAA